MLKINLLQIADQTGKGTGKMISLMVAALLFSATTTTAQPDQTFRISLSTRDSADGNITSSDAAINPAHLGVVIVDTWDYHWCMTWNQQAGGMTPRMNRVNECLRKAGITIIWAPTDVASMFSAWPQRQKAMAVPYIEVPVVHNKNCRFTVPWGKCLCGPGIPCIPNYGENGLDPRLLIGEDDYIVNGTQELYSLCSALSIDHLIYFGGATNICLTGKPEGLGAMYNAGLTTWFARDLSFAWTMYDPATGYTPQKGNEQAIADLERCGIPTLSIVDALVENGLWNDKWITEPVRITPSGTKNRPYLFEKDVTVTLEIPYENDAVIRFTTDGSEPGPSSPDYRRPIVLTSTTELRTAAYRKNRKVSSDSETGWFVKLPSPPPPPDIPAGALQPVRDLYAMVSPEHASFIWQPAINRSYEGKNLRIRNRTYDNGIGMRAPGYIRYEIKPEWKRFVSLAGIDDNMLENFKGANIAGIPKVIFKVFIDGELKAESPVMRISQEWRFEVPIPGGSRQIVLVCDDLGERSPYNLGNWVNTGFTLK